MNTQIRYSPCPVPGYDYDGISRWLSAMTAAGWHPVGIQPVTGLWKFRLGESSEETFFVFPAGERAAIPDGWSTAVRGSRLTVLRREHPEAPTPDVPTRREKAESAARVRTLFHGLAMLFLAAALVAGVAEFLMFPVQAVCSPWACFLPMGAVLLLECVWQLCYHSGWKKDGVLDEKNLADLMIAHSLLTVLPPVLGFWAVCSLFGGVPGAKMVLLPVRLGLLVGMVVHILRICRIIKRFSGEMPQVKASGILDLLRSAMVFLLCLLVFFHANANPTGTNWAVLNGYSGDASAVESSISAVEEMLEEELSHDYAILVEECNASPAGMRVNWVLEQDGSVIISGTSLTAYTDYSWRILKYCAEDSFRSIPEGTESVLYEGWNFSVLRMVTPDQEHWYYCDDQGILGQITFPRVLTEEELNGLAGLLGIRLE